MTTSTDRDSCIINHQSCSIFGELTRVNPVIFSNRVWAVISSSGEYMYVRHRVVSTLGLTIIWKIRNRTREKFSNSWEKLDWGGGVLTQLSGRSYLVLQLRSAGVQYSHTYVGQFTHLRGTAKWESTPKIQCLTFTHKIEHNSKSHFNTPTYLGHTPTEQIEVWKFRGTSWSRFAPGVDSVGVDSCRVDSVVLGVDSLRE